MLHRLCNVALHLALHLALHSPDGVYSNPLKSLFESLTSVLLPQFDVSSPFGNAAVATATPGRAGAKFLNVYVTSTAAVTSTPAVEEELPAGLLREKDAVVPVQAPNVSFPEAEATPRKWRGVCLPATQTTEVAGERYHAVVVLDDGGVAVRPTDTVYMPDAPSTERETVADAEAVCAVAIPKRRSMSALGGDISAVVRRVYGAWTLLWLCVCPFFSAVQNDESMELCTAIN